MFEYRNNVPCSGVFEELCPGLRIEVLGFEHREEVLIAKLRQWTVRCHMMLIDRRSFLVHLARIPLVSVRRYGVEAPVNEDAKLCVPVPVRSLILRQRLPVGLKRSLC